MNDDDGLKIELGGGGKPCGNGYVNLDKIGGPTVDHVCDFENDDPDYVVWDYQRADSPGVHRIKPPAPDAPQLQEIRGSGFGCVVLPTDLLRNHVFSIPPGELYYDPYFWETVGDEWKRLCDWTCVCRHLTER